MGQYKEYPCPSPVIAERIAKVMEDNDLNAVKVANAIGMDRKSVYSCVNCVTNPNIRLIRYLVLNYKVDVAWLLDLD